MEDTREAELREKIKSIKKQIEQAKINQTNQYENTSLHGAVKKVHRTVTEYPINQGAGVKKATSDGQTTLRPAASLGRLKATKLIPIHGANIDKEDKDGHSGFYSAALKDNLDVTKYLICQGAEGRTALHSAAQKGYLDVIEYLISQGAEVNKGDDNGSTALHVAAQKGHLDVTKYLISKGAEVNKGDRDGRTAFNIADHSGHLNVTTYLISLGADVNRVDNDEMTELNSAAYRGHIKGTKYLIGKGAEVNEGDKDGCVPLHSAAQEGHLHVTKYLISKGAEVDKGDNEGWTALHSAASKGHLDVTKYLIDQGAEVNKGFSGRTALHIAAQEGHLDVIKYLIIQKAEVNKGDNDGMTALHSAAHNAHLVVTKCLIGKGSEVNKGSNDGWTALHATAYQGHLKVTKYLINQGAEVNQSRTDGRAALHWSAKMGHLDVTKCLISLGAEVNNRDINDVTALHNAAFSGHLDVTKCLIGKGAEVNKGNIDGWTALHGAAHQGHLEVTKYLVSHEAEVKKGNNKGWTALHSAAFNGHLNVTKYLISQGAEVNKGHNDGRTPLYHAVQKGYLGIVKVLLAGGARFDTGDIHSHTPQHLSLFLGYQSIADLFVDRSNSKLAQNDSSEIHLAIQHGHTSVIEKLVSEGADLNVQSTDGQTCLHKAIKLCYKTDRIVQEANTLQKISDEYYMGELSPERALVFYLLENGAKLDVKDGTGNLPIQYAKDEVLKQMILWRLASIDEIPSFRDEPSTPTIISAEVERHIRQEVELEGLGVSMLIPPEAVRQRDPFKITLALLRDPPRDDIQDDESVACYGIRCDPPNMIFHKPVKIRIPHSTLAINPDQVKPYIVSKVWDSVNDLQKTSRNRSSSSPSKLPYCRMYEGHLELYIGHCAEWWVLIPLEQQVIRHQLMCTPYIPETVERGKKIGVHLHIHADVPGIDTEVLHNEKHQSYRKAHHSVPFSIISNSGDVTVARDCEGRIAETKLISLKEIHHPMRHNVVLKVPPSEDDTPYDVITITLTQSGNQGMSRSMTFSIRYEDQIKSPEFTPVIREIERTSQNDLPDVDVHKIAEKLSIDDYYDLGVALGFPIQQLDAMEYKRHKDRQEAIWEMLITWKQKQLPNQNVKEVLLSILKSAETEAEKTNMFYYRHYFYS